MKKACFFIFFSTWVINFSYSQDYLDIVKINFTHSPEKGINSKSNPLVSDFYNIDITLPVELKKDGDAFIINPFFTHNEGTVSSRSFHIVSQGLAGCFLKKFDQNRWSLLTTFILRRNKEAEKNVNDLWQYGAVLLATKKNNSSFSYKFGLYYNKEFFGNFFVPLVGLDWKIDNKNSLFGVLPGNLFFEHRYGKVFFWGSAFHSLTNSYRLTTIDPCFSGDCSGKNYLRINDNQLGLFAGAYITSKIVFQTEVGHSLFRKYRFGFRSEVLHNYNDYKNDNLFFKFMLAYRYSR